MPDTLGNISVPADVLAGSPFPIIGDWPISRAHAPGIVTHEFLAGNAKISQRYLLGDGSTRFTVVRQSLTSGELSSLLGFWETCKGGLAQFTYSAPNEDGTTTDYTCRFADPSITFERLVDGLTSLPGVTLAVVPTTAPTYTLNSTATRFPGSSLQTALLAQVQRIIPLVKIQPKQTDYPAIYVSDRRCTVGSQLYLARLLDFDGISQAMGNDSDTASFKFGNADRAMTDLANDVNLMEASIELSLFHVGTGVKLDLWKGEITDWSADSGPEFSVQASDGIHQLGLPYPTRQISRQCHKEFDDGQSCPYSSAGSGGNAAFCDKGFDTTDGCVSHGMANYFGGQPANPQGVHLRQLGGPQFGMVIRRNQSFITSVSAISDTVYNGVLRDIYTDADMEVNCDIVAGREESEFYDALGIVGRGPLTAYGAASVYPMHSTYPHTLDNQPNHGPGRLGLRESLGADPNTTEFSLGSGSNGVYTYGAERAAGTAFLEIRRTDPKGQQLSRITEHSMRAVVNQGLSGFIWTDVSTRTTGVLTNPIWIAVNILLTAKGMQFADAADQAELFDVQSAIDAADICDESVTKLIGSGTETQFKFRGVLQEQKPLRDWIQEILMNCLGYYTHSFGKLRFGVRINSSVVEAFTSGNVVMGSLQISPLKPQYNHLTANFADEEWKYAANSIQVYDLDHAKLIGGGTPVYLKGTVNLSGTPSKSQAARIISTRLREETGGTTATEQRKARIIRFRTTVLALSTEVGTVCSMTDELMPDGAGEFRVTSWRLNKDYSIDIEGRTTTDSMYDLTSGPKPADIEATAPAFEYFPSPERIVWHPNQEAPNADDPLYDENEKTFGLTQDYTVLTAGEPQAALIVTGEAPVNVFPGGASPPYIAALTSASSGGSLVAGSYYVAVIAKQADGQFTRPSNVISIQVSSGTANTITLADIRWPAGTYTAYYLFACRDDESLICWQEDITSATSYVWTGPLKRSTWTMPNENFDFVRVKGKTALHLGNAGVLITSVGTNAITCPELAGAYGSLTGRVVSVITDASDGSAAPWHFTVTSYDSGTGIMGVTPNPDGHVEADVLIVRSHATGAGALYIEDTHWVNGLYPSGMTVNAEAGYLVRIIAGTGRGQVRTVVSNTATRHTIDYAWSVIPDATSVFIVEAPSWEYQADSTRLRTGVAGVPLEIRMPCPNMLQQAMLVCCVGVDRAGREALEDYLSPMREIWLYGQTPGVRTVTADYTVQREDRTILADTTAGPVTITLRPGAERLSVLIKLITPGTADDPPGYDCNIEAESGEDIEGVASVTLTEQGQFFELVGIE
jgi:hypothetical protein